MDNDDISYVVLPYSFPLLKSNAYRIPTNTNSQNYFLKFNKNINKK